jgi:hypothetical protein
MEFNVIEKRSGINEGKGTMYQEIVDAAVQLDAEQELAIAKNGKKNLRHTLYQLFHRKELPLRVSEDKDTVYIQNVGEYIPKKSRS